VVDRADADRLSGLGGCLGDRRAGNPLRLHVLASRRKARADCVRALCRYLWITLVLAFTLEMLELGHMEYEAGSEWHVLSTLLTEHLAVSYGLVQVVIGSICPFFLLLIAIRRNLQPRLMIAFGGLASLLVLVQVFAMRWNVVVGGQLFSKSYRGFVEYTVPWGGREGMIAAIIVLTLPLLALWAANRLLPLWSESEGVTQEG
jgi:hypothetical protein